MANRPGGPTPPLRFTFTARDGEPDPGSLEVTELPVCLWCEEPADFHAEPCQQIPTIEADGSASMRLMHADCGIRSVAGSLGHQRGRCSCFGGDEEDPAGVSRRLAARAAAIMLRAGESAALDYLAEACRALSPFGDSGEET